MWVIFPSFCLDFGSGIYVPDLFPAGFDISRGTSRIQSNSINSRLWVTGGKPALTDKLCEASTVPLQTPEILNNRINLTNLFSETKIRHSWINTKVSTKCTVQAIRSQNGDKLS